MRRERLYLEDILAHISHQQPAPARGAHGALLCYNSLDTHPRACMHPQRRRFVVFAATGLFCAASLTSAQAPPPTATSPDGLIQLTVATVAADGAAAGAGQLVYSVTYRGKPVIEPSVLGLDIQDQPVLGTAVRIAGSKPSRIDETYTVPAGKSNPVRNVCNVVAVELEESSPPNRRFTLEVRAYDDGVAFRYLVPDQTAVKAFRLVDEKTQFQLSRDATTYPLILGNFRTSYEDNYRTVALSGIHPESLVALPLLAELPGVAWIAITEADIDNYAGMYLVHNARSARVLEARLAPRIDEPGIAVTGQTPVISPWRVVMIAAEPGRLIESNLVINLNPPCAIPDASWIKPGKTAWDWWSGTYATGVSFQPGMNTATMKHYIDFASRNGIEYMLIDAGWAAHTTGPNWSAADITQAQPDINMPEILALAKSKNIGVWVWAHWTDVDRQMDVAFPLYEQWGLAGVKIDFMDRDDQWMVNFYRRVAKKAAEHHLMVDFHGAFKPDGLRRTYPNVLTREGVLGLEYTKWSARVHPDHVMLAFTRMLAGPMDYTPGGFRNVTREAFEPRFVEPLVMGTRAHQVALYVVFESPFQMVVDYPGAYEGQPEMDFIRAVPTTWDETRVLNARVGDYVTVARRRGKEWYVGSIAGWHAADLEISLSFLGPGEYVAEIYSDAADAAENPTHTSIERMKVTSSTRLKAKLVSGGGQAIRIRPGM
jgi:alpha-glucosidase